MSDGFEKSDGSMSYYELVRIDIPASNPLEFQLVTATCMNCCTCGRTISGMGGPGRAICIPCGDLIENGQAKGCIKWDEEV